MNIKEQLSKILVPLKPAISILRHNLVFITILIFVAVYTLLVVRINALSGQEPTDEQVQAKSQAIQRPKVDEPTLKKIQQLQDENIQVKALFDHARQNPFAE